MQTWPIDAFRIVAAEPPSVLLVRQLPLLLTTLPMSMQIQRPSRLLFRPSFSTAFSVLRGWRR